MKIGFFERVCPNCEDVFLTNTLKKIYCTSRCSQRFFYKQNPEKFKEKRKVAATYPEKQTLSRIKSKSKLEGIPFNLELEDIVFPTHCPVLGIKLFKGNSKGYSPTSPSLDRIVPQLGYTKGNVRVISARANLLKNDATLEELELVVKDLKELHNAHSFVRH